MHVDKSEPWSDSQRHDDRIASPRLPESVKLATSLIGDPALLNASDVANLIKRKPDSLNRMLAAINTPYFDLRRPADSSERLLMLLGAPTVVGMLMLVDLANITRLSSDDSTTVYDRFVRHSAASGFIARHIADKVRSSESGQSKLALQHVGECYSLGVLHDWGVLAMLSHFKNDAIQFYLSELSTGTDLIDREIEVFGDAQAHVAANFSLKLRHPEIVRDVVRYHLAPSSIPRERDTVDARMVRVTAGGHAAACLFGYGFPQPDKVDVDESADLWSQIADLDFGMSQENVVQEIMSQRSHVVNHVTALLG